jgi:type I restriction enzyme, S subunit
VTFRLDPVRMVERSRNPLLGIAAGWERVPVGQVADVINGSAFPSNRFVRTGGAPLVRIRDVVRGYTETGYEGPFQDAYRVPAGSLLIGMDGDFNVGIWPGPEALLNQRVCRVVVRDQAMYSERFLRWVLPGYLDEINGNTSSVTVKHLSSETLKELPIPLPPRPEQDRIVAAIEEEFSRIDAAGELLTSAGRRMNSLRQSTIDHAVTGESVVLKDLLAEPLRNGHSARASSNAKGVRTLTLTAVTKGDFSEQNTKLTTADPAVVADLWLRPGDILIERSNTPDLVGTARMYRGPENFAIFPDLLIRVRLSDAADPRYLEMALQSTPLRQYFKASAQGISGSMPKISQPTIERAVIPVPSLVEQRALAIHAEVTANTLVSLTTAVQVARRKKEALRSSILKAAFTGRLVL